MPSDYILNALLATLAVSSWIVIAGMMCWIIEELLPRVFPRLKQLRDDEMEEKDNG